MKVFKEELLSKLSRLKAEEEQFKLGLNKNPSIGKVFLKIIELKNNPNENIQKTFRELSRDIMNMGIDFTSLIEEYENEENQQKTQKELEDILKKSTNKYIKDSEKNVSIFIDEFIISNENLKEEKKQSVKTNIEAYLLEIYDYERVEFIENFRIYSEIKKELGLEEDVDKIIEGFSEPREGLKKYIKDFNKYTLNHMYIDNKLKAQKGSSNDVEFFYKIKNEDNIEKQSIWKSRSGSITKAAEYHFEDVQNNTHSYKTYLKECVLNKYQRNETIDTIKKNNYSNSFSVNDNQFTRLLSYIDTLDNDNLLRLQTSGENIEDIIEYLSFFSVLHNIQDKKNIKQFNSNIKIGKGRLSLSDFCKIPKEDRVKKLSELFINEDKKIQNESDTRLKEFFNSKYEKNEIKEYGNNETHRHDFVIFNSAVVFNKVKSSENIICGSILFSHIFNEIKSLSYLNSKKETLDTYFNNSFNIHKSLNINIKYVKGDKVITTPKNGFDTGKFIEEIKSEEGFLKYLKEITTMLEKYSNLNKTLQDNITVFIDSLIVLSNTFFKDKNIIMDKIEELSSSHPCNNFQLPYSLALVTEKQKLMNENLSKDNENLSKDKKLKEEEGKIFQLLNKVSDKEYDELIGKQIISSGRIPRVLNYVELVKQLIKILGETEIKKEGIELYYTKSLEAKKPSSMEFSSKIKETLSNPPKGPKKVEELSEDIKEKIGRVKSQNNFK